MQAEEILVPWVVLEYYFNNPLKLLNLFEAFDKFVLFTKFINKLNP